MYLTNMILYLLSVFDGKNDFISVKNFEPNPSSAGNRTFFPIKKESNQGYLPNFFANLSSGFISS